MQSDGASSTAVIGQVSSGRASPARYEEEPHFAEYAGSTSLLHCSSYSINVTFLTDTMRRYRCIGNKLGPPIRCIVLSKFDVTLGPKVVVQAPEGVLSKVQFDPIKK